MKNLGFILLTLFVGGQAFASATRTIDADSISSSDKSKTYSMPSASTTLVGTDSSQTLTNKTISGTNNTIQNIPSSALKLKRTINAQSGTTYTFVLADGSDAGGNPLVTASNSLTQTYTVPPNSSVAFPVGSQIDLSNEGAGTVTVAAGAGVTINAANGLNVSSGNGATLVKTATDSWRLLQGSSSGSFKRTINAQSGTTYTFALADGSDSGTNTIVTASNSSAQTYTVPPNSSAAFAVGSQIDLCSLGSGAVTLAQGSGVTINSRNGNKTIAAQYVCVSLIKTATDTWLLFGDLVP